MSLLIHSFTQQPGLFDTTRQILFTFRSRKRNKYKIIKLKQLQGGYQTATVLNAGRLWQVAYMEKMFRNVNAEKTDLKKK